MMLRLQTRLSGAKLLLVVAVAMSLAGCSRQAEASAPTRAQREIRLLRGEVTELREQVRSLESHNEKLVKDLKALRETSFVRTTPDGFALRLNFGATAVLIAALAAIAAVRITRMRIERAPPKGAKASDDPPAE